MQSSKDNIHYTVQGDGQRAIILLHGWGCTGEIFKNMASMLAEKFTVYSLDLPGFGHSPEPVSVCGIEWYTEQLEQFVERLELKNPILIGHSFGGRMSILYGSRNEVDKIVLIGSAGVKPRRKLSYYLKVYSYKAVKNMAFLCLGKERGMKFLKENFNVGSSDYNSATPIMRGVLSKVVNEDLQAVMPRIKASTLLIWGQNDTATPIADAHVMERLIADSGLVALKGCGHYVFLENPATVHAAIGSFLQM